MEQILTVTMVVTRNLSRSEGDWPYDREEQGKGQAAIVIKSLQQITIRDRDPGASGQTRAAQQ